VVKWGKICNLSATGCGPLPPHKITLVRPDTSVYKWACSPPARLRRDALHEPGRLPREVRHNRNVRPWTQKLYDVPTGIQRGITHDYFGWMVSVWSGETSPGVVPVTRFWPSLSQRFPQQSAPLYSFVKSGYLRRPTMPLSAHRYADGLFGEDHHPLKLFIPLEVLRQEVSPLAEEDVPLIEHQRGQFRFRRTSGAMGHRRSVEPYRSPLWYSREPSMRI
jgi:hypothetical protein